jgi:hypothetical protein
MSAFEKLRTILRAHLISSIVASIVYYPSPHSTAVFFFFFCFLGGLCVLVSLYVFCSGTSHIYLFSCVYSTSQITMDDGYSWRECLNFWRLIVDRDVDGRFVVHRQMRLGPRHFRHPHCRHRQGQCLLEQRIRVESYFRTSISVIRLGRATWLYNVLNDGLSKIPSGGLTLIIRTQKWGGSCKVQRRPPADILNESIPPENPQRTPCSWPPWPWFSHEKVLKIFQFFYKKKYKTLTLTLEICILQENGFKELTLVLFQSLV